MISPIAAPAPQLQEAMTQLRRAAIIDATKLKVLPNPDAPCLQEVNTHTPTGVLVAAVYATLEKKFFDTTHSRMDIASAFKCNASQVSKAITGIEYQSGPHHYKPKAKWAVDEEGTPEATPTKKSTPTTSTKPMSVECPRTFKCFR